jgi:hypothetical protein
MSIWINSLVLKIVLGIIVAKALIWAFNQATQILTLVLERTVPRRPDLSVEKRAAETQDWGELWSSVSEETKEEARQFIEDDLLRRRVQSHAEDLNFLWPYLWAATPEETKKKMRARWELTGRNPSYSSSPATLS